MVDGVMSSVGMGLLLSSNILTKKDGAPLYINKKEGPLDVQDINSLYLKYWPVDSNIKKSFVFDYDRDNI
jgi:hypothetical protein